MVSSFLHCNAKGHKLRPRVVDGLRPFVFYLYYYYMGLDETTMPSILKH